MDLEPDINHKFVSLNAAFLVDQIEKLYNDGYDFSIKTRNFMTKISGFIKKVKRSKKLSASKRPYKLSTSTTSTEVEEIQSKRPRLKRTPVKRKKRRRKNTVQPLPEIEDSDIEILEASALPLPSVPEYDGSDSDVVITFE